MVREGPAIEPYEGVTGAGAPLVDGASHHLFSRAAFADQEHSGVARSHQVDQLVDAGHRRTLAHDLVDSRRPRRNDAVLYVRFLGGMFSYSMGHGMNRRRR